MYSIAFPMCCAASIFADFGNTATSGGRHGAVTPEEADKYITNTLPHVKNRAFVVLTLNGDQKSVLHETVTKHGFKEVVVDEYHPAHNTRVSLYVRLNGNRPEVEGAKYNMMADRPPPGHTYDEAPENLPADVPPESDEYLDFLDDDYDDEDYC